MGTRGFITFAADGEQKTAYNHRDSYPGGLGLDVLKWLRAAAESPVRLGEQVRALRVVDPGSAPTADDISRFRQFAWTRAQHGGDSDLRAGQQWYDLLHETQGNPAVILEAGIIEDASGFPADSLIAEWGYVIDLDGDGMFEVYEGFQSSPHGKGRFAAMKLRAYGTVGQYYPVALVAKWPLADLPDDAAFIAATEPDEDES